MSQNDVTDKEDQLICTDDHCINDQDECVLVCKKCDRKIHYRWSQLTAYQVFVKFESIKFLCQTYIKPSKELKELLPTRKAPVIASKEIERLKNEIQDYESQIKQYQNNKIMLTN